MSMKGLISGIKRMEIHDGDGLRTTVFFKGCPLKCVWCHNPESISYKKQIAVFKNKCIECGNCANVCENDAATNKANCSYCFKCAENCPGDAIVGYGKEYDAKTLVDELLIDAPFFKNGRGGVTLSGGECLSQPDFAVEVAKLLKENDISVYVDTCGYVKRDVLEGIIPFTDKFLFDIKAIDEQVHIKATSKSNTLILDNLKFLDNMGCNIEIRIPFVPEFNVQETEAIARFISTLKNTTAVKVLKYHNFAASRYEALGMENKLPTLIPTDAQLENAKAIIKSYCPNIKVD